MTVAAGTRKAGPYTGDGVNALFPFAFKVFQGSDVLVVLTDLNGNETTQTITSQYTVALNSNQDSNPGGTVTMLTAPTAGYSVTIGSQVAQSQGTTLTNTGGFFPTVINDMLDRVTILVQQLSEKLGRTLSLPFSAPAGTSTTLPLPASNKLIGWNSTANGMQNIDPVSLATVVAFGTANADVFTGTGAQTAFTLSANPGAQANLDVSVGGVTQTPGVDYTWSGGTTVTFTTAPPNGARVLLRYFQGLPQGTTDSAASTFIRSGSGTTTRTVQDKLREIPSLYDFAGATDDARFASAKANGVAYLRIPAGVHTTAGWSIASTDSLVGLVFDPGAQLLLTSSANAIALDIQKPVFAIWGTADVKSTGTMADGNNTIGIRCGTSSQGLAYCRIEAVRFENFSSRGVVLYQSVYCGIERITGYTSTYGLSCEPLTSLIGGSTVEIGPAYIVGCTRGINLNRCSWVTLREPVVEYCGSSSTTDGALHFDTCTNVTVVDRYGEQNARNMVKNDSIVLFIGGSMFAATAADVVTYSGVATNSRGATQLNGTEIRARRLNYDNIDNADLTIGSNLVVPATGGSVIHGNETKSVASGTLTSATWTTVATIPTAEYAATVNTNAFYEYVCYAGAADLSTGFDAGTFMNGTLRSYSGALPAWLRFSGGNIQMNVTSSSYGLNYKIVLRRVFPG
jgi:hypothetical protein